MATKKRATAPVPEPENETVWMQIPVPTEIHRALKMRAAGDGMTLKDAAVTALGKYVGWEYEA